jgi:hypothetical protein
MPHRVLATAAVLLVSLAPADGCGDGRSDAPLRRDIVRGAAQLRSGEGAARIRGRIVETLARLRRDEGATGAGRRARALAIQGFTWTLRSFAVQDHMRTSDSGNLPASVLDAERADRYRQRGDRLVRAALAALGP